MCRFALIKTGHNASPQSLLNEFSDMAQKSNAPDGDTQKDGWGVAWVDAMGKWKIYKSLKPIWDDKKSFAKVPKSNAFVIHARSASFPQHQGVLEFNQPYAKGRYAFVFNGLLRGVSADLQAEGRIGAEKIWSVLQMFLNTNLPEVALLKTKELILQHTRELSALNIGLADGKNLYALCCYSGSESYYALRTYTDGKIKIITSEPFGERIFQEIEQNTVFHL